MTSAKGITAITNGRVITPTDEIQNGHVCWDSSGTITSLGEGPVEAENRIDAQGMLVCPGFINLHVHGGLGHDTMDATPQALAALARYQAQQGVTTFLPTTTSSPHEKLIAVGKAVRTFMESPSPGAEVLGLHIEGPYISAEKSGAQNRRYFRDPDWDEFCRWQQASGNAVRLIAMAPERDPDGAFIPKVVQAGVVVAAAHTNASYETSQKAFRHGLSHGTHIFNAMSRFDYRKPRVLESLLENNDVSLELIPDCTSVPHVHPAAIRLLKRIAGVERICTITDSVSAAGMPDGEYALGGLGVIKSGEMVYLKDHWIAQSEKQLAGSALEMQMGIRNLVQLAGFTLQEAVRTATINPARVLKIQSLKGSLTPGKEANITLMDPRAFDVKATFVRGKRVYERD